MMEDNVELLGFIIASKQRIAILHSLEKNMKTPSLLSKDLGISITTISSHLQQLRKKNIIECVNLNSKKGRLYRLTQLGEQLIKNVEQILKNNP